MLRAGDLRRRITLQQRVSTQDGLGQQQFGWTTVATLSAKIESLSGQQLTRAQSIYNEVSHKVTVRWQPLLEDVKVVGSYRILYAALIFDVGPAMNIDERNRVVELLCKEGLNDGQ